MRHCVKKIVEKYEHSPRRKVDTCKVQLPLTGSLSLVVSSKVYNGQVQLNHKKTPHYKIIYGFKRVISSL